MLSRWAWRPEVPATLGGDFLRIATAVFTDGDDAVVAAGLRFVLLGLSDDLAVAGFPFLLPIFIARQFTENPIFSRPGGS